MQKRYQVFVSSTYTDLQEERQNVFDTLMKMNQIPAGMELFPAIDEEQWNFIKRVIDDSDYYILIIGGRYGSVTAEGLSYTELEFDYAVSKDIKVIALIHKNPDDISFGKSEQNPELRERLAQFREKARTGRIVKFWENASDLPGALALSLSTTITTYPAVGWVRANQLGSTEAVAEINTLNNKVADLTRQLRQVSGDNAKLSAKPSFDDIAGMDERIIIAGTYQKDLYGPLDWHVELTWTELFSEIAPALVDPPTDAAARDRFAKLLFPLSAQSGDSDSMLGPNPILSERDFHTTRIQFTELKLIHIERAGTVKGGVALFWQLTPVGENLLIKQRLVRRRSSE